MSAWTQITCLERDDLLAQHDLRPFASRTDLDGQYGDPEIYTEWGHRGTEAPVLRDWRWPGRNGQPDTRPCRHEQATPDTTTSNSGEGANG